MTGKIIKLSLKSIMNNKMRSFLTMLGIIIGVMAVVILVSITQGATNGITESISSMGSDSISAQITDEDVSLTIEQVEELSDNYLIESTAPIITASETIKKSSNTSSGSIKGVTEDYFDVMQAAIQSGRIIRSSDVDYSTKVAVIGTDVAMDLFDTWDAVGGTITIGDKIYTVVGVLEEEGSSFSGSDNSSVLIPITSAQRLVGSESITSFYAKSTSSDTVEMAVNYLENYLYQLTSSEDSYSVSNESDVLDTMDDVSSTMSLLLGGIAAISLVVGGIGIMNIMLVSVSERTKEIGIRKSIGAKRRHILTQFLCEACILSVLGGLIGLLFSWCVIYCYNYFAESTVEINKAIAAAAIVFCAVIGVGFGSYPAAKASKLQPIDALHTA
ncbi:MAG: ABC transporter permease [Ruminococcus sp.]|nr:ABC transporter permease [Ruminococcus sp.]